MNHTVGRRAYASVDPGVVTGLVTMLTLGTAFGLAALGVEWFWLAFPVGFGGVMPVAVGAAKGRRRNRQRHAARGGTDRSRSGRANGEDAALARLRERYADGELDEAAFESRLERLLLTEDVASARGYAAAGRTPDRESASDDPRRVSGD